VKIVVTPTPGGVGPGEPDDVVTHDLESTFPDVNFVWCKTEEDQLIAIEDADAYCGLPTRKVFLAANNLKWIHCAGTGIDGIMKIPELIESDIPVTNSRESHVSPMATHVFALITSLAQRLPEMLPQQMAREWRPEDYKWRQVELEGAVLGIYGFGNIGRRVAKRASGFDMEVYAVDKNPRPSEHAKEVWGLDKLDDLIAMSDWFVVACPYTDETMGSIDGDRIASMKPNAHIIIISRGGIVDEQAMCQAIRAGELAGAGLDAMAPEPPESDSLLWDTPNVIFSPHASALVPDMYIGRREVFKENLRRFIAGEPFIYECDKVEGY
jgi:phosphoglycerate dehydrogenase-like enzyme